MKTQSKAQLKQAQVDREQTENTAKQAANDTINSEAGVYTLSDANRAKIDVLLDLNMTRAAVGQALSKIGLNKAQVETALEELMPERAKSVKLGLDDLFHQFCCERKRTNEEMIAYINEIGSPNFIRVTSVLLKRGAFFNALHDKYSN